MPTPPSVQVLGLPRGRALTRDDLDTMPDDGHRYELIDGVLIVSPAPILRHQRAVLRIAIALDAACPDTAEVLPAPFDVVLARDTVIQPDVLVARRTDLTARDLPAAPLLAVEVLSPSTRGIDLLLKAERLARAQCPYYWTVDPAVPSITTRRLTDGEYAVDATAQGDEPLVVELPFPITLTPSALVN